MMSSALGRFRLVSLLEGVSYLSLLGVAMPLKYLAGMPLAVKVSGWTHGVLFVLFVAALLPAAVAARWSIVRIGVTFATSLVPFGAFFLERHLRREERASPALE